MFIIIIIIIWKLKEDKVREEFADLVNSAVDGQWNAIAYDGTNDYWEFGKKAVITAAKKVCGWTKVLQDIKRCGGGMRKLQLL